MRSGLLGSLLLRSQQLDTRFKRWRHPNSRAVLLNVRVPMNYAVMAPLCRAMSDDPRVQFYVVPHEGSPDTYAGYDRDPRLPFISRVRAAATKFDACIAADFIWGFLPRGTPRIQMFHGVAGKFAHIYDRPVSSVRAWHRLFFINRRRLRNFIATGAIDAESPAARLVGMPKLDCLVDGSLQRRRVLETLRIDPTRTTVLYAPTWSPYSSLNAMGEAVVSRLTEAGYAVMVKLHERSRHPEYVHSGSIDWHSRLQPLLDRTGGQLLEGADSSPYLIAADILITDHSSIGFEYLLLDRPLIRIEMPDLIARTNVNPEYVELLASASTNIRSADQLQPAVESSLRQPNRQSQARKAVAEELFYQPGTATLRAVKNLYEVLELDPPGEDRSALRPSS